MRLSIGHRLALPLLLAVTSAAAQAAPSANLTRYDSKYYIVYTDLDPSTVREAINRMTRMVETYRDRTKSFSGGIRKKFPFYLYRNAADYYAAGGMPRSGGMYRWSSDGTSKLMATAGPRITAYTWHTVQHEGFHQFTHEVIGGEFPTWMNEGLAEYFGEGLYTGDGFVTGVIPPWRLKRVQAELQANRFHKLTEIMAIPADQWASEMSTANYDQAWSMVHFLVHADSGKYQSTFGQVIREISQGRSAEQAWRNTVGSGDGFEDRWRAYWLALPPSPTHDLYVQANVATLTSFLARATAQRQKFADLDAFLTTARGDQLKCAPDDWLPPSLLADALKTSALDQDHNDAGPAEPPAEKWELRPGANHQPTLSAVLADGTRLTGWFTLGGSRVGAVNVETDDTARALAAAKALSDAGKRDQARAAAQAALRQHPASPLATDVRAFLKSIR